MKFSYWLLLATFLVFPIIAISWTSYSGGASVFKWVRKLFPVFATLNIFFYFGYSIRGDYADYTIFSLEYLWFCMLVIGSNIFRGLPVKLFRMLGMLCIGLGFVVGFIGIVFFILLAMDLESDKRMFFSNGNERYEVRRFSSGFATSESTRYTFDTYRTYGWLPVEKRIDVTSLLDTESPLYLGSSLHFDIMRSGKYKYLVIKDETGRQLTKSL